MSTFDRRCVCTNDGRRVKVTISVIIVVGVSGIDIATNARVVAANVIATAFATLIRVTNTVTVTPKFEIGVFVTVVHSTVMFDIVATFVTHIARADTLIVLAAIAIAVISMPEITVSIDIVFAATSLFSLLIR